MALCSPVNNRTFAHILLVRLYHRNCADSAIIKPMRSLTLVLSLCLAAVIPSSAQDKKAIYPEGAAKGGNFAPAILAGGTLYVSGQVGRDAKLGKIPEDFEQEVAAALDNNGVTLKAAGYDFKDAVSVQVYLTYMELFQRMNAVYVKYFPEPRPARATVGVAKLVSTARIEISVTAWKNPKN